MMALRHSRILWIIPFLIGIALWCPPVNGKILYVDDDAKGATDGTSWTDAHVHLQDALADANESERPVEIRVAQGIYKPDQGKSQTAGDRQTTFRLISGVSMAGGYAGTGSPDPNQRDTKIHETVLSGDIGEPNNFYDNCWHVVTSTRTDKTAILDGFTIMGGNSSSTGPGSLRGHEYVIPCDVGGGLYNDSGNPTLIDCTFRANSACYGGGMCNFEGNPTLVRCTFTSNGATYAGGGMTSNRGDPNLVDCVFMYNGAGGGAGMYNKDSNPVLTRCQFLNHEGGMDDMGGGMYNLSSVVVLADCLFSDNVATFGGAMYNSRSTLRLAHCTFRRNRTAFNIQVFSSGFEPGGAMYNDTSDVVATGCVFASNQATVGGGIYTTGGSLLLVNCRLIGNRANSTWWGAWGQGAGILSDASTVTLTNCTFHANEAARGGSALACSLQRNVWDNHEEIPGNAELNSCIVWDSGTEVLNDDGSAIRIAYSDVRGGQDSLVDPNDGVVWDHGNMDTDPFFADPGHWDNNATPDDPWDDFWIGGDYHLKSEAGRWDPNSTSWIQDDATSPCIDAGDPNMPVGDEPEPNGGRINMGAYAGTKEASKSSLN